MTNGFKVGDRVEHTGSTANKLYKPGVGTVQTVSTTRVMVLWDNPAYCRHGGGPRNYVASKLRMVEK